MVEEMQNAYKNMVQKPQDKKSLGRPRYTQNGNITTNFKEVTHKCMNSI
jgi:hypothetical protein